MKLVTNSNNINTLKLLICGNFSNSKLDDKIVFTAPSKVSGVQILRMTRYYPQVLSGQQRHSACTRG